MTFKNCYADVTRADSYARLEFANTYYLAFRDLPDMIRKHVREENALDFGCGTGRSTRFIRGLGFNTVGIDISPAMIGKAKELDPEGDYRLINDGDFSQFPSGTYDLIVCAFTFDNIAGLEHKAQLFRGLAELLKSTGTLINIVSSPEIYVNEWASFSTRDYVENRSARSGEVVRIMTKDFPDSRPAVDILCSDECYRSVYSQTGLAPVESHAPLATGDEPYAWINETRISPWAIYVLQKL